MRYNFNMVIGDYFGDGHGRTQSFHIGTDKPIKDVLEAQTQIIAKTGIDLHSFANKFEDDLLPADVVQQLKKLGYPFRTELYEDEKGLHFQTADTQADCPEELRSISQASQPDPSVRWKTRKSEPACTLSGHWNP